MAGPTQETAVILWPYAVTVRRAALALPLRHEELLGGDIFSKNFFVIISR
jgi:hypothetical protein